MDFTFNNYAITLIFCGVLSIVLSNFIFSRGGNAVKWFTLMMLSTAAWSIAYGLELASTTLSQIKLFINIEYFGVATLPIGWFYFCLNLSGKECWYKKIPNVILTVTLPIATIILTWTNDQHHLLYSQMSLAKNTPFPVADLTPGPWYYIFTGYFYVLLACGCYLILKTFKQSNRIYKNQNNTMLIAAAIPWFVHLTGLFNFKPFGLIDVTPFSFILTNFFIIVGIYRFKLFDIVPIAREKVLELMRDGFLVIDQQHRVIDYNQSISRYIDFPHLKVIGSDISEILKNQAGILNRIENRNPGKVQFSVDKGDEIYYLEADILFLDDNKFNNNFIIVRIQDLTTVRNDAVKAQEQAKELEKLNQLKDRIFSIMAHDLRGPLVNLSEVLKMLSNDQISDGEFRGIAPTLSKDIIYTTDLLENILHWSRSQLKGFGIKKEYFNVRNLILNEINYHLPAASMKKIEIIHDVFPGEMAYGDVLMIQIVVRNLINNAIKFCNEYCELHITAVYQRDQKMLVCFKDNGIGISEEILAKLFNHENVTTRGTTNERGTGLGLLICSDFMKRNDGSICVESKVGSGSKFFITLPTTPVISGF